MSHRVEREWSTASGLRAYCVANMAMGHRCGYVALLEGHPLYNVEYIDRIKRPELIERLKESPIGKRGIIPAFIFATSPDEARWEAFFDVHGGVTYSGNGVCAKPGEWLWGFDCGHAGDARDPSLMSESALGFYPRMGFEDGVLRDEAYVVSECERLAEQLRDVRAALESPC